MKNRKSIIIVIISISIILISLLIFMIFIFKKGSKKEENKNISIVPSYNNPIIPEGFHKVETEDASWEINDQGVPKGWNSGLVIEDENENQFVWVPKFEKQLKFREIIREINLLEDEESAEEKQQIEKFQGFYIARYEAGVSEEMQKRTSNISEETNDILGTPVSKKGVIAWNFISLKNAKINATNMYNTGAIKSDLISSRQWLYVMDWLYRNNYDIQNSPNIGNFANSKFNYSGLLSKDRGKNYMDFSGEKSGVCLLTTGVFKTNNIYDLAGNLMEYTDGYVKSRGYYSAGGYYSYSGTYNIYNLFFMGIEPLDKIGYRMVLYLK